MNIITDSKGNIKAKLWIPKEDIESSALEQVYNMANHPRIYKWVSIMPDVHMGIGATIGAVLPMEGVLIPAAVGVDIGCGMCAVKTDLDLSEIKPQMKNIHNRILHRIPLGFEHRNPGQMKDVYKFSSKNLLNDIKPYEKWSKNKVLPQLGTLGGGNHFIELQKDENDNIWIMLHSGSRNIGNLLATEYIKLARKISKKNHQNLAGLDFLEEDSDLGIKYIDDMSFSMEFARQNRFVMVEIVKSIIEDIFQKVKFESTINIHHNYAEREKHFGSYVWVHRKGATKASSDTVGIIPGSMANPSYIVSGKGNDDSFNSCAHGAGRVMSRRQAKRVIEINKFRDQMDGIYSESVNKNHLDEAPDAYKNIKMVMGYQEELVDIKTELKPIFNIKG